MTYQEAYLDGFCKAAEAAGVDPIQLYKQAAPATPGLVGKAVKGVKRFGELLGGGRKGIVRPYRDIQQMITSALKDSLKHGKLLDATRSLAAKGVLSAATHFGPVQRASVSVAAPARELRKVLAARLAAGGAVAGGLGLAGAGAYDTLAED